MTQELIGKAEGDPVGTGVAAGLAAAHGNKVSQQVSDNKYGLQWCLALLC